MSQPEELNAERRDPGGLRRSRGGASLTREKSIAAFESWGQYPPLPQQGQTQPQQPTIEEEESHFHFPHFPHVSFFHRSGRLRAHNDRTEEDIIRSQWW